VKSILKRLGLALLLLIPAAVTVPELLLVPWALAFGWINSLGRLLPRLDPPLSVVIVAMSALLVLVVGTHWFCGWLHPRLLAADAPGDAKRRSWPWKWTLALHGGLWLVFFAVMGLVGIVHQVAWMAASGEPMFASRTGRIKAGIALNHAATALRLAGDEAGWNLAKTQVGFWSADSGQKSGSPVWEQHQVVFLPGDGDQLGAAVLIPRDPRWREQAGLAVVQREEGVHFHRGSMLPEILAEYQGSSTHPPP
jgi:hypothetical protein